MTNKIRNPLTHFVIADDNNTNGDYETVFSMQGETGENADVIFTEPDGLIRMSVACQLAAHAIELARIEGFEAAANFLDEFARHPDGDFDISDFT